MLKTPRSLPNNGWYGVERDMTSSSPDWTRIGNMSLHVTLPVQNLLKGCLLNADKTVNYFLKSTDWTKREDNTASNLTGADGNVMIRKTAPTYWFFETVGNIQRVKCSIYPLPGFTRIDIWNLGAYEAKLVSTKLSSVKGVLPTTSRSETQFRADARANGSGYQQLYNEPKTELTWMFVVEYATFNFQKAVDLTLTSEGFKKGGLGNGVTTAVSAEWSTFNGYNPFILTGTSDALGNASGEVSIIISNFPSAGNSRTFTVPRYRGVENFFGHIWEWVDGVSFNHLAGSREIWIFDNPSSIADNTSTGARLAGYLPLTEGYAKTILLGAKGDILPTSSGGSSATYICDYFYAPALGSGWRALISGGIANYGAVAGPFYANADSAASSTYADFGARLFAR